MILNLTCGCKGVTVAGTYCWSCPGSSLTGSCVEQKKKEPVFGKGLKMSDSFLEQRVSVQPSAKLEKRAYRTFDMLKDSCKDKEMPRRELFDRCNKSRENRKNNCDDW